MSAAAGELARKLPPWSGALHYFRVEREAWGRCLDEVRGLGLGAVESYVPWGVHEAAPGRYDFAGGADPRLDLRGFLDECAARELAVILRPGPHVNAELTDFGFPARVLDDPACQARTSRGTPAFLPAFPRAFPVPSYASRAFLAEARRWIEGVGKAVRPHLAPAGPVVALQVDNELGSFFRTGAYDLDYHEDALARWTTFLRARYGDDLARLCAAHGERYASFDAAAPPRAFAVSGTGENGRRFPAGLARHLDWMAFKDELLLEALGALREMFAEAGLAAVPLTHNFPPADPPHAPLARAAARVDLVGMDFYHRRSEYRAIRRRALYLAGSTALPYAPEVGCGMTLPWLPIGFADQAATALAVLMHGVRGANFYMLVERERWYGGALTQDGDRRPRRHEFYQRLVRALRETDFTALRRDAPIGLLVPRGPYQLAAATSLLDPAPSALLDLVGLGPEEVCPDDSFGLSGPVQTDGPRAVAALERALSEAHLPYVLVDEDAPLERLLERRALVVPTFDFVPRDLLRRLRAFTGTGGVVVAGPVRPALDERLERLGEELPASRWLTAETLADPAALAVELASLADPGPFTPDAPEVDATVFRDASSAARVVFLATDSRRPLVTRVALPAPGELRDALTDEAWNGETEAAISLPAFGVRMLRWAGRDGEPMRRIVARRAGSHTL